ncbi:MAG: hypothetical protein U1D06_13420 [Paracoccaceae bacterium]|nr:hypothetical protein [Paracoccaceae bacterium]
MTRRGPLFVARRSYRRRRLRDAARLLPVLGCFLIVLPMLWGEDVARRTGSDGIYLFVVWVGLVGAAAALARGLNASADTPAGSGEDT